MKSFLKIYLLAVFIIGMHVPMKAQKGEERFLQAMMKEEGEGKLKEAIAMYTSLVDDKTADRVVRAKALLQMGICYEKLGVEKATGAFEKLIAEYSDQSELIAVAKRKLRLIKKPSKVVSQGLISQRIQKSVLSPRVLNRVSPDGRYYSFFESTPFDKNDNTIVVHDLLTDKMTSVSEYVPGNSSGKKGSQAWNSVWAPNGKKLAYSYANNEAVNVTKYEVHVVNTDGSGKEVVYSNDNSGWTEVWDFSKDGKTVLFSLITSENENALMEVDIVTRKSKIINVFNRNPNTLNFRYDPSGNYITYTKQNDIYTLDIESGQIAQVTSYDGMDSSPEWSLKGDKLLFISDRQGSNDLYSVEMTQGKPSGTPTALKRQLGEGARIMGLDTGGALYVQANNSKTDIYTLDFSDTMDILPDSKNRINLPVGDNSNGLARYSHDGKYISFQSRFVKMTDGMRSDVNSKYLGYDEELGYKYSIYIYNSETNKTKLLDLPLYLNHVPRSQAWMVPTWSFNGHELLVHGRIRENFEGGFFIVDVEKETITPALTKPNCKVGMKWHEVEVGNSMFFSRKKDVIYYQPPGWKEAIKYNIKTGESTTLFSMEDGTSFWFGGFLDEEETLMNLNNRHLGYFSFDINTGKQEVIGERGFLKPAPRLRSKTKGFTLYDMEGRVVFQDVTARNNLKKNIRLVMDSGETKEFNLSELFSESLIRLEDYDPGKKQLLLSVMENPGKEIYKISNLFD